MISRKQETERKIVLVDMLKPRIAISMETVIMTKRTGFQNYELDGQEQEALISLRDARKRLQHATMSRRFNDK